MLNMSTPLQPNPAQEHDVYVTHVNSTEFGCIQEVPYLHMLDFRTAALMNEIP
jgi:hypothetical protein